MNPTNPTPKKPCSVCERTRQRVRQLFKRKRKVTKP